MKIRVAELRRLIREVASTLGWPTDKISHIYGVPDRLADHSPTDLGDLKLPKGPNSRDDAEDRPLTDMVPANKGKRSYGARRGVATSNKSNHNSGSST